MTFQRQHMKWHGTVESLGEEFSCPLPEVERMLSTVAQQLEQGAQVKDFIPVLAVKEVRDLRESPGGLPHVTGAAPI